MHPLSDNDDRQTSERHTVLTAHATAMTACDTASNAPKLDIDAACKRPPSMVRIYSLQPADRSSQARAYTSTLLPTRANAIRGEPLSPLVRDSLGSSPQAWSTGQGWIRGQDPYWVDLGSLSHLLACCSLGFC